MAINSCKKGKNNERAWALWLKENLGDHSARRGASQGRSGSCRPDVECAFGVHWEVKAQERLNIDDALSQAIRDCQPGNIPAVAHKKNRTPWSVTILAKDLVEFSQKLSAFVAAQETARDHCGTDENE